MSTRAKWVNGILKFFDGQTFEEHHPMAPLVFYDDFLGSSLVIPAAGAAESGMAWTKKIVGAAPPTVAGVADHENGVVQCALTADVQKQDAGLYFNDERNFSLEQGMIWEARIRVITLPTLTAEAIWGVIGDWADGPDAILYSAFFTADGGGEIFCEVDDNATDQSATSGVTVLATEWHIYKIDFTSVADIRFYIDGVHVATGTTFAYAATGANAILQPYLGCYKAGADAGLGSIKVDYVRIMQKRS